MFALLFVYIPSIVVRAGKVVYSLASKRYVLKKSTGSRTLASDSDSVGKLTKGTQKSQTVYLFVYIYEENQEKINVTRSVFAQIS